MKGLDVSPNNLASYVLIPTLAYENVSSYFEVMYIVTSVALDLSSLFIITYKNFLFREKIS